MRRLALALALLASVTARPALADHGASNTYAWTQRTVIIEDRTGVQFVRDAALNAVTRWNQSGAAFTLSYRDGPVAPCGPEGNVVSICERPEVPAMAQSYPYLSGPGVIVAAWIGLAPHVVRNIGSPNVLGIVAHEVGHTICCYDHSDQASILNPIFSAASADACPVECTGPNPHDFEVMRAVYGPAFTVPTGVRFLTDGSGLVGDVPVGAAAAPVMLHARNGATNQQWSVTASGGGYRLTNVASGLVLTAMDYPPGSTVAQWPTVRGSDWQRWAIEPAGAGWRLRNLTTGLCADTAGTAVVTNTCGASQWGLAA